MWKIFRENPHSTHFGVVTRFAYSPRIASGAIQIQPLRGYLSLNKPITNQPPITSKPVTIQPIT